MAEAADPGYDIAGSLHPGRGELLQVLVRLEVKFVVIGGAAIQSGLLSTGYSIAVAGEASCATLGGYEFSVPVAVCRDGGVFVD